MSYAHGARSRKPRAFQQEVRQLDDQELDPIEEALSAVDRQFSDPNHGLQDADDTLDASDDDEDVELSDDLEAQPDDDTADDAATEQAAGWDDPSSPYHQHYLEAQRVNQQLQETERTREAARQLIANHRAAQANAQLRETISELNEIDPELSGRVQNLLGEQIVQTRQVREESLGVQHGIAALHMALVNSLPEDQAHAVIEMARGLAKASDLDQMQMLAKGGSGDNQRIADIMKQNQVLQLQLAALQKKNPARDAVDSNRPVQRRSRKAEETETFDDFYENWEANPFR